MLSTIIKNKDVLLSHGNIEGRKIALDIIEHGIKAINAYDITRKTVYIKDNKLIIGNLEYDSSDTRNIYVIGAGKATFFIAKALDEVLGEKIKEGIIIVKRGERRRLRHIKVVEAGHPIPDEAGLKGTDEIVSIAREARERDIVICVITGGASALMPSPAEDITLEDIRLMTELLLKSGATIEEINTVRNHISTTKGGRLARYIHPAEIINLIIIDEIRGEPWGPTAPDASTFKDAVYVLKKYNLWRKTPEKIRNYLKRGLSDNNLETLKTKDFKKLKVHNIVLADNKMMCEAAKKRGKELGFTSRILSTRLEGESREAGAILASIAKEIEENNRPIKRHSILILGGETTVTITGKSGRGGPSQELVLGASLKIMESEKIVIASVDTDGTDGPTEIAGGIVDGYTVSRAREKGIDIFKSLRRHNSYHVLTELQDAIITGPTGTNVMDLDIIVVL